jgi:hypothetical protein
MFSHVAKLRCAHFAFRHEKPMQLHKLTGTLTKTQALWPQLFASVQERWKNQQFQKMLVYPKKDAFIKSDDYIIRATDCEIRLPFRYLKRECR